MATEKRATHALHSAILQLLRPLVSLLIKNGVSYKTFANIAKWLYYDVARTQFTLKGRKQTLSRISVLTGLSRKDVRQLKELLPPDSGDHGDRYNRGARVISGWLRDKRCLTQSGRPRSIPITGGAGSFDHLVRRYSGDIPTRAVLDELARIGILKVTSKNRVRLIKDALVPSADDALRFNILGTDVGLLIATIEHNLNAEAEPPYFQRKVSYNNLPEEALRKIRETAGLRANDLLDTLDTPLAAHDRDVNRKVKGTGRYEAGIGIYYFERPFDEET